MSDAICGPSNPLQQFKQQTNLDRTLQQDRLASRHSPAQGFRSANPNAALLDPEFEAFQAGVAPAELPHFQPFQQPPHSHAAPSPAPSWAADFQQMHISSPPPFQQQQRMPQQGLSASNWARGFREHIAQTPPRAQTSASSPQQFQQMARFGGMSGFQSSLTQSNMMPAMQSKGKEPAVEHFDEAAFERAFDQANQDMVSEFEDDGELDAATEQHQADAVNEAATANLDEQDPQKLQDYQLQLMLLEQKNKARLLAARQEQDQQLETQDLGTSFDASERLETQQDPHQIQQDVVEEQAESQERRQEDEDALAATAQELLQKVEHNQTDKFRNSQFLGLMRKLRDREVKVDGDQMVETNNATTAAAETQTVQPLNSPSAIPRFDNSEQRPAPLSNTVDARPYEYGIPREEQDHDSGRKGINARDGQEVVDMLNQPGPVTDDIGYDPELAETAYSADSTNGTSSPYLMTRFPPGMRTVV